MHYLIYKTTNLLNGKIYVGQHRTSNLDDGYLGSGTKLLNSVKKYGRKNFKVDVLETCTFEDMNKLEIYWIDKLDSTNRETGYNICNGGQRPPIWSDNDKNEWCVRMSGDGNGMYGKKHSTETRKK